VNILIKNNIKKTKNQINYSDDLPHHLLIENTNTSTEKLTTQIVAIIFQIREEERIEFQISIQIKIAIAKILTTKIQLHTELKSG